tara:strand:+ start:122089 stop:122205 length:117 start_codon:yes stop_codon:yes gene_type:complete
MGEEKDKISDDGFDAIAGILLVVVFAGGLIYWLSGMPA